MKIARIIILTVAVLFLAAATATAERSLWLYPKNLDGTDIEDAYVGRNKNPWLRKSYVVGGDPFLLEISNHSLGKGKKDKTAKNVRLVLAINDPDKVDGILIDGEDIWNPDSVKYGIPKLASGRRMPKHGVFPTSFVEVDIGDDIPQNGAVELEIDVNGDDGLMVHFDAYGKGRPKKCKGKHHHKHCDWKSHRKHYLGKWHHKHYKDSWYLKHCYWKYHHKHCHSPKTCFRDVFNPFSHDVTVVIEDVVPLPVCEPEQLMVSFTEFPEAIDVALGSQSPFTVEVKVLDGCILDGLVLKVDIPFLEIFGEPSQEPLFVEFVDVMPIGEASFDFPGHNISWRNLTVASDNTAVVTFKAVLNPQATPTDGALFPPYDPYRVEAFIETIAGERYTEAVDIEFHLTGFPIPQ